MKILLTKQTSNVFAPDLVDKVLKLDSLLHTKEISESGYGGVLSNGNIVDRREHPEAIPFQKNSLLGLPQPQKLPNEIPK